jgi:hypothetical protein
MKKQNLFASIEDALDQGEGVKAVVVLSGFLLFAVTWAVSDSFWIAVIFAFISTPILGCGVAFFVGGLSMMFARRDEDALFYGGHPRLHYFFQMLFALIPLLLGALMLAFFFFVVL